uniref:Uncharacterized protein n=1 Tax=Solanum lycopersicum TaxID=4081 RepID=A0A3Q7HMD4_SOLLC
MLGFMEHKIVIDNHRRANAWIGAQNHSQKFGNRFKKKIRIVLILETNFGEPDNNVGTSNRISDVDLRWSREDVPGDVIDMPTHDQHSENMEEDYMDTLEEDEEFDDVDSDWMLVVMKQRVSSRIRNRKARATVPAGTLTSLSPPLKKDKEVKQRCYLYMEGISAVGPSNDVVIELSSFLGTLARNETLCPLNIEKWKLMDTIDDMWDYTKKKYDILEISVRWTLKTGQESWRRSKFDLKEHHFDAYANDQIRMENKPADVPTSQFKELLKYWNLEKFQKMSKTNSENRKKLKNPHTVGKKSFALVLNDLAEMKNIEMQQKEDGNETIDAFSFVMGSEHPGRLRLY